MRLPSILSRSLPLSFTLLACGDGGSTSPDGGPDGPGREVIGTIGVTELRTLWFDGDVPMESSGASVRASFYDGHAPRWHRETMRAGACVLAAYTPSSCEPFCDGVCVDTDVCEPWPALVAAGALTVRGLSVAVRMPGTDGFYHADAQLPGELFTDDATITAELAGGGGIPASTLSARGVPALRGAIPDGKLVLAPGHDATVAWTPAGGDARVRLTINANNQGHGMPYLAIIECDVDDAAGAVTVPAAMIDAFPETRAWTICAGTDCPPSTLRRYHRATAAAGDRDVELVVSSVIELGVDHILPD